MTDTANPLVVGRVDSTQWYSGLGIAESVADIVSGVESGSWIDGTIGGVSGSLDALGLVVDPLGSLVSWGVAWLLEHVKPLSDALDWLAGDPDQITAYAQTWRNVARNSADTAAELRAAVLQQLAGWAGAAAEAYRAHAAQQLAAMEAIGRAAGGIGSLVEGAGLLVALVRELVRDLIADFVSVLAVRLPMWLAEEGLTLGLATPLVVSQVGALVAKWAARIAKLVLALINSLRRLSPLLRRLGDLVEELQALLRGLSRSDPTHPTIPKGPDADGDGRPHPAAGDGIAGDATPSLPLTDADRAALHYYTTDDGYLTMNPYLRNPEAHSGADGPAIQAQADQVSDGLAKLPREPGTTYRGVDFPGGVLDNYEPGQVVTERAFTSTSRDPGVAQGAFDGNTLMVVTGQNGRDVAPFSAHSYEAEILYDKGTRFKVMEKLWDADIGKWIITLKEM